VFRAVLAAIVGAALVVLVIVWVVTLPRAEQATVAGTPGPVAVTVVPEVTPPPVVTSTVGISPDWISSISASTGIPAVALNAYALAAVAQASATPRCGVGWTTLAGLGYAESAHGTIDGAHLDPASGELVGTILGPVLDGGRYDVVRDTDAGALDGDTTYDRAVGPLQFLPATWQSYGLDGNADGVVDPNNIFDAARAAAAYLCTGGRNVRTGAAWAAGIRSYNPNDSYVTEVLAAANDYATRARSAG
jgi:membrane-bound lytic murein transglycosylase B